MSDHNQASFTGRLTRDPEIRYSDAGKPWATFDIAVNRSWKDGDEWREKVAFIPCKAWGYQCKALEEARKGSPVFVAGSIEMDEWTDREGGKRSRLVLNSNVVELVNRPPREGAQGEAPRKDPPPAAKKPAPPADDFKDDIPF